MIKISIQNLKRLLNKKSNVEQLIMMTLEGDNTTNMVINPIFYMCDFKNMSSNDKFLVQSTLKEQDSDSFAGVVTMSLYVTYAERLMPQKAPLGSDGMQNYLHMQMAINNCKFATKEYLCRRIRKSHFVQQLHNFREMIVVSPNFHDVLCDEVVRFQKSLLSCL